MEKVVLAAVPAVIVTMLVVWLWSHGLGLQKALEFETRRSDALETALTECRCK